MSGRILPLTQTQAKVLAGCAWRVAGRDYVFKPRNPKEPGTTPWKSGAEGMAYPLQNRSGTPTAYLKFFNNDSPKRFKRVEWLIFQGLPQWIPHLAAAPLLWLDSREVGRPDGVDFDLTGCVADLAPGDTWLELKFRLSENSGLLSSEMRWRMASDLIYALAVLEKPGLIHGDLSPNNLLVHLAAHRDLPAVRIIDFDAFAVPGEATALALTVAEGGTYGTAGYCPPDLVKKAETGDLSIQPYSDRRARDMLLLEFLFAAAGHEDRPPAEWDLSKLETTYSALHNRCPAAKAGVLEHLHPARVFSLAEGQRPSSNKLAESLGLNIPPISFKSRPQVAAKHSFISQKVVAAALKLEPRADPTQPLPGLPKPTTTVISYSSAAPTPPGFGPPKSTSPPLTWWQRYARFLAQLLSWQWLPAKKWLVTIAVLCALSAFGYWQANRFAKAKAAVLQPPFANSLGMVFVPVAGTTVRFSVYDTRVQDYETFARITGRAWTTPNFEQGPTHPAVNVSWDDAQAFAKWLTEKERKEGILTTKQSYRLPQDWEWSVAVGLNEPRDGTPQTKDGNIHNHYPWGTQWPPTTFSPGNYADILKMDTYPYTSPVGSFNANKFGLYDMGGNVWQWCEDLYSPTGTGRVLRGGSWTLNNAVNLLSSYRYFAGSPDVRADGEGFRLVLVGAGPSPSSTGGLLPQSPAPQSTRMPLAPYTNNMGMAFVPVAGTAVRFSVWDTRVQDYETFARVTGRAWTKPDFEQGPTHPAVNVSWVDAQAFCHWLTARDRQHGNLTAAQSYRLPLDWEWSVAAGLSEPTNGMPQTKDGRIQNQYPWGTQWPPPTGAGNYDASLRLEKFTYTSPGGSFAANRYGLYDMGGNVWQWCQDQYSSNEKSRRVLRGGSWDDAVSALLSSFYHPPIASSESRAMIVYVAAFEWCWRTNLEFHSIVACKHKPNSPQLCQTTPSQTPWEWCSCRWPEPKCGSASGILAFVIT